jgi:hypothetical protein
MPNQEDVVSQDTMCGRPYQVTSEPEGILNDSMNRLELLCLTGGFESSHLSFALSRWLMGDFSTIVGLELSVVDDGRHDGPMCRPMAPKYHRTLAEVGRASRHSRCAEQLI